MGFELGLEKNNLLGIGLGPPLHDPLSNMWPCLIDRSSKSHPLNTKAFIDGCLTPFKKTVLPERYMTPTWIFKHLIQALGSNSIRRLLALKYTHHKCTIWCYRSSRLIVTLVGDPYLHLPPI